MLIVLIDKVLADFENFCKKNWSDPEKRKKQSEKHKGKICITNGKENKYIFNETDIPPGWYKGVTVFNHKNRKGIKLSDKNYIGMMKSDCHNLFTIIFNDKIIFKTISPLEMIKYVEDHYKISRTIIEQIINQTWKPKFNKHKHLVSLKILKEKRSKEDPIYDSFSYFKRGEYINEPSNKK